MHRPHSHLVVMGVHSCQNIACMLDVCRSGIKFWSVVDMNGVSVMLLDKHEISNKVSELGVFGSLFLHVVLFTKGFFMVNFVLSHCCTHIMLNMLIHLTFDGNRTKAWPIMLCSCLLQWRFSTQLFSFFLLFIFHGEHILHIVVKFLYALG